MKIYVRMSFKRYLSNIVYIDIISMDNFLVLFLNRFYLSMNVLFCLYRYIAEFVINLLRNMRNIYLNT